MSSQVTVTLPPTGVPYPTYSSQYPVSTDIENDRTVSRCTTETVSLSR